MSVYRTLKQALWGKREREGEREYSKRRVNMVFPRGREREREAGEAREGFMVLYTFFGLRDFSLTFTWVSRKKRVDSFGDKIPRRNKTKKSMLSLYLYVGPLWMVYNFV